MKIISQRHLTARFSYIISLLLLVAFCAGCSSKRPEADSLDLSADRSLWKIYKEIMAIRRDAEETFKNKSITPQEAEACFKRNEAAIKKIIQELSQLDLKKAPTYSPALRQLAAKTEKAVAIARDTYVKKRICDIKGTKNTVAAISKLSAEIPVQRTHYLLKAGCTTEQIYEVFRQDGFADEEIQEFILKAMKNSSS